MIAWPQPVLETARLVLRPFAPGDAPDIQRLAGAREIADTTLLIPHPYLDGLAEKFIATQLKDWKDGRSAAFAIVLRATNQLCGATALRLETDYARAEIGYWIGLPFWGQGLCTEAARAVLGFGFTRFHLNRIYAQCFARNPASARVLQKLGLRHEGCLRQHARRWDTFEDLECYGIVRAEWEKIVSGDFAD